MAEHSQVAVTHPAGEQPPVEEPSAIADTFGGRVHIEWDATAPVTPFGQLPFFIDFLKQANLFDPWVADCPLYLTSPNAPRKRDLLVRSCCRCWPATGVTPMSPRCAAIR